MPELTISMPAYNSGKYIGEAIDRVLAQEGVDFELMVVDDGSGDNTAEVIESFGDSRIKLIRNKKSRGVAYCHNLVIEQSNSPYIMHINSDDLVLPGAFQRMIKELKKSPDIGQVCCYFFIIDTDGKLTRESFRERRRYLLENIKPDMDCKKRPATYSNTMNRLRTYRREVFDRVGRFNEKTKWDVGCDMALRVVDNFEINLVPEFLCASKHVDNEIQFFKEKGHNVLKPSGILLSLRLIFYLKKLYHLIAWPIRKIGFIITQILVSLFKAAYSLIIDLFSWWPIDLFYSRRKRRGNHRNKIGYYLWHYPTLSETFIQREILAIKSAGISIYIIADGTGDVLGENQKSLIKDTHYLNPFDRKFISKYTRYFFFKNPLLFANLFLYVVFHRYGGYKSFNGDIIVLKNAINLAGVLKEKEIDHIHSPWADRSAFVTLVASRMVGISCSVQARAHDIHRKTFSDVLPQRLKNADFIITNTEYNKSYLKSVLKRRNWKKIHIMYNGINLEQFKPKQKDKNTKEQIKILSVARLIEEKGIPYLLKACKILEEKGYSFVCEIIGEREDSFANEYVKIKKLHNRLGLKDRVLFSGALPFAEVLKKYEEADIFVLPCVVAQHGGRDITPNSLIEAMAMKLPVVSTKITGIPEIVDDDINGILIAPNDEDVLAKAIIRLIENKDLRERLSRNARKKVEEKFNIEKNSRLLARLFKGN